MNKLTKQLYDMEPMEEIYIESEMGKYSILRVPGGWIFHPVNGSENRQSVFVPFYK